VFSPTFVVAADKKVDVSNNERQGEELIFAQVNDQVVSHTRVVKRYKTKGRASGSMKSPTIEKSFETSSAQGKVAAKSQQNNKVNNQVNKIRQAKQDTPLLTLAPITQKAPPSVSPAGQWLNKGFTWIDSWFIEKEVKPWQKEKLAEPAMLPGGVAPEMKKFASKIYISKAATLGGDGIAGGGCGCK
jgi:hypothetical protein